MSMGLNQGWIAPVLKVLKNSENEISLTNEQCSWVASLLDLGRVLGTVLPVMFLDAVGCKKTLAACTMTFFLVWLLVIFTKSAVVLYGARFLSGIATGVNDVTVTIYVGENSHPKLRGIFCGISIAFFYGSCLLEFAVATYSSYDTTAIANAAMVFFTLVSVYFCTESVQFLLAKGKLEKAKKNYYWLRGKEEADGVEFEKFKNDCRSKFEESISFRKFVSTPVYYSSVTKMFVLGALTAATGYPAISSFISITLSRSNDSGPSELTILFGLFQFIGVCCSSFLMGKLKRRTILLSSSMCIAVVHLCTAILCYVDENIREVPYCSWIAFVTVTLYGVLYVGGILPVCFALRGELFPQNVKSIGGAVTVIGTSLVGSLTAKMFLPIVDAFGIYANFLLFSSAGVVSFFYVYLLIQETAGKSLIEIERLYVRNRDASFNSA